MESHSWPRFRVNFDAGVGGIIRKLVLREMNMEMGSINLEKSPKWNNFLDKNRRNGADRGGSIRVRKFGGSIHFSGRIGLTVLARAHPDRIEEQITKISKNNSWMFLAFVSFGVLSQI